MNKKTFAPIFIIPILAAVAVLGAGSYWAARTISRRNLESPAPNPTTNAPVYECIDIGLLDCTNGTEPSFKCTKQYQVWAGANCPSWKQEKIECKTKPQACTMECLKNPPYICGSDDQSYCSTCQACANENVSWYIIQPSPCGPSGQEICGGIAGIECPDDFICQYDGSYPDASGICIPKGETITPISEAEITGGWYYGNDKQKKPNTPKNWIYTEAGRSSCWHNPDVRCGVLPE